MEFLAYGLGALVWVYAIGAAIVVVLIIREMMS